MVKDIPGISSSLFVLCLNLDRKSTVNSCGPGLYRILHCIGECITIFFAICVIGSLCLS